VMIVRTKVVRAEFGSCSRRMSVDRDVDRLSLARRLYVHCNKVSHEQGRTGE
jgi:hypothetical protein